MDYEISIFLRQSWVDPRLAYNRLTNKTMVGPANVDSKYVDDIWTPDLYFQNEKKSRKHEILKDNIFLEIAPDGQIMLSQRVTITLSCAMNFKRFPFDSQICDLDLQSYV